ncbi:hypothetical protein SlGVgp090 [Spodoptera litura granulovirus]|uniref:Uncharacterized protein n=1 Tax=Spodoptera litura granulovirus TaxID=359919 RepID=A5IZU2_9BBAC|nr:hypothetical protein SlGVgp090 [Spodoptera litura granulovirus]ABQ52033.1 hypothetical protein SlGVgp090 [Spodoptera litura granulovirus]
MDEYNYVPDGAHRHLEIERVQKEIIKQHKYIESQLNLLKNSIRNSCLYNCSTDPSIVKLPNGNNKNVAYEVNTYTEQKLPKYNNRISRYNYY